jgi:hypothetical protein
MGREGILPARCQQAWRRPRPTRARAALKACATLASCVTGLAIGLAATAAAQQPFVVDDAEVTPSRTWHIEISSHVDWLRAVARPVLWQGTLESDVNYGLLDRQTGAIGIRQRGTILLGGGSLVAAVSQRLQVGAELTTAWSQKATMGGSFTAWQAGGNLVLRPGLTLDAGVLGGWGDASSRWGLQIGTSIDLL